MPRDLSPVESLYPLLIAMAAILGFALGTGKWTAAAFAGIGTAYGLVLWYRCTRQRHATLTEKQRSRK